MNKIHVMDEMLANKIAAGEVVEKCSSVVKELVENSIDALSSRISVELTSGGIKNITVIDDGVGMSREDAELCFQRHATSKIKNDNDLYFINTLGFRGEALPSIAAVSNICLKTCDKEIGTIVNISGGKIISIEKGDSRIGTIISISDLFFNTPARLKHLKSESSELTNTTSLMEKFALSYPNISFTLINNNKKIMYTSGSGNLLNTIHEIYNKDISSNMIKINGENDDYEVSGYICKPEILRSNKNYMHTIINGRIIKNNELNKIIDDAYYTYKPDGKYPIVVIKIETDPTLIDVNIHPTKQDIKFSKINSLKELLSKLIKDALYNNLLVPKIEENKSMENDNNFVLYNKNTAPIINLDEEEFSKNVINESQIEFNFSKKEENNIKEHPHNEELKKLELYPVGLCLGTYIVAQNDNGIYLIDQHAAQERINYEKYKKSLKNKVNTKINLLIPITIEMSPSEYLNIKNNINILIDMGFDVQEFGINTLLIKSHPTWIKQGYEEESIRKIIDILQIKQQDFKEETFNERVSKTLACKMSIKANTNLSLSEMENLLNQLVECDNPYNCPHGRPTIISFSTYELEKMFKRVMD